MQIPHLCGRQNTDALTNLKTSPVFGGMDDRRVRININKKTDTIGSSLIQLDVWL
jgi:hypothetical protein